MTIAFLATGDELIHGDTLNTNAFNMAKYLSSEGYPMGLQMLCSDKEQEIAACLEMLNRDHDIIIITGGLGPTSDDKTRFAVAKWMQTELLEFNDALTHIAQRIKRPVSELNPGNRQQALFPPSSELLPNPNGTALGAYLYCKNSQLFMLPGPPQECLPMFENYVLPLIQNSRKSDKVMLKWLIFGVAESEIAQKLEDALVGLDCKTGYRLDMPYVEFKVSCNPQITHEVEARVIPLIKPFLISPPQIKASMHLLAYLETVGISIEIKDEVTGGMLSLILQKPQTKNTVQFWPNPQAEIRLELLGLSEYWNQEPKATTSITVKYSNKFITRSISHTMPYRNANVIYYATEWLCATVFQILNQLH